MKKTSLISPEKKLTLAHFTADHPEHVCPVLRVTTPAQAAGWQVLTGATWQQGSLQLSLEIISEADAVLIQREFPAHTELYHQVLETAHTHSKPVIYEIDDLLTELPESHPGFMHFRGRRAAVLAAVAQADAVTCATQPLAAYLRTFNPHVSVLPNYLLDKLWTLRSSSASSDSTSMSQAHGNNIKDMPITLGYLGSLSHIPDLAMIAPLLAELLERYGEKLRLRLWGIPAPPELAGHSNVETLDIGLVNYAEFAAYFVQQQCDLFIAPLEDNPFNRCKSAIKFLEYSALGIPGVFSNLPPYADVITPGQDGLLAATPDEWLTHLETLVENPELRQRMGQAAQDTLRQNWLLSTQATAWEKAMQCGLISCLPLASPSSSYHLVEKFLTWSSNDQQLLQQRQEQLQQQQQHLQQKEAEIANLEYRLADLTQSHADLVTLWEEAMEEMRNPGWRLFKLADAFRVKLAPPGSLSARGLGGIVTLSLRIKHIFFDPILQRLVPERFEEIEVEEEPLPFVLQVQNGDPLPKATIHVIIERNPFLLLLDEQAVLDWVTCQTCSDVQVIAWDSSRGLAEALTGDDRHWNAANLEALCRELPGLYLCFASTDLLQEKENYLEINQIVLSSEKLAFTVNTRGQLNWPLRHLQNALLPGCRLTPFFRQVVNKTFVRNDFSLDLAAFLPEAPSQPVMAGKLLMHPTDDPEFHMTCPMETNLGAVDALSDESYILIRPINSEIPWQPITHTVQPVNTILPVSPESDNRPALIVIFPFLAVGGAEQLHLNLIEHLKEDIRFIIVSVDPLDPSLGTLTEAFAKLTPHIYQTPDFIPAALRLSFLEYLLDRFQPVGIYIASGTPWIYDVMDKIKARYPGIRLIDQVYDSQVGWIHRYNEQIVHLLDACIGANQKICQAYIERGVSSSKVFQVEHGIDARQLDPQVYTSEQIAIIKEKLNLPLDRKVITFASRLHPQKRPMDMVELARRMSDNESLVFLIAGDGPLAIVIDQQITRSGLANVVRRGFYRPISDILAVTDVLVLPSEFEGMPLIVSEAQIMGKPVVVTDVGNNRDVLENTGGGVVVSQLGDVAGLMAGVRQMLQSPPDGVQVRQKFLAHYGMDVIAEKYRQVLLGR